MYETLFPEYEILNVNRNRSIYVSIKQLHANCFILPSNNLDYARGFR